MLVVRVLTPCGLAGRYRRFGGTYCCLQTTNIDNITAVRTSNLAKEWFYSVTWKGCGLIETRAPCKTCSANVMFSLPW
jgi:hypothetical protein